jgi:hypothetical protein
MDYWLSKASETEAQLDQLRVEFEETTRAYKDRIEELERTLLEANLNAQSRGVTSETLQ